MRTRVPFPTTPRLYTFKKPSLMVRICNPSAREAKTGRFLVAVHWRPVPVRERDPVSENKANEHLRNNN